MIASALLDSREPQAVNDELIERLQAPCIVTELPCGDVWMTLTTGEQIIVERKTMSDLLNSIRDGRLFNQVADIVKSTRWGYVVIPEIPRVSGGMVIAGDDQTGWQWSSVQGALLTCQDLGAGVVFCEQEDYVDALIRLAARDTAAVKVAPRRTSVKTTPQERVLMSLPHVGIATARTLLDLAGNVEGAWYLLMGDLREPPEIVSRKILSSGELARIRVVIYENKGDDSND